MHWYDYIFFAIFPLRVQFFNILHLHILQAIRERKLLRIRNNFAHSFQNIQKPITQMDTWIIKHSSNEFYSKNNVFIVKI